MKDMEGRMLRNICVSSLIVTLALAFAMPIATVNAAPTTITAYKAQYAVNVKGAYQSSQWSDTPMITEPTSGMTFAVKQNGTGWLFLMIWQQSSVFCSDQYCFGGIELGHANNTQPMGSPSTPTIMILSSTSFKGGVDEFISTGEQTPVSVESDGYSTQSICGLNFANGQYTAQCYRPFKLTNASPYDFPTLGVGSTIEIGFAVGEFSSPGDHAATDMSSYVLAFSGSTYSGTGSSSSTSSSSSSSTSSSRTTTSTTSSSSTSSISSSSVTSSSSTTSSLSTSSSVATSTTSSSSSSVSGSSTYALSVGTNSKSYSGTSSGVISGAVTGSPTATGSATLRITNPSGNLVFSDAVSVQANGAFNDTFHPGVNSLWTAGSYTVTASWSTLTSSSTFSYTPASANNTTTVTTILTSTASATVSTITTTATQTGTVTQTTVSTVTQTKTEGIAGWVYAVIAILLLGCIALGYIARLLLDSRKAT